MKSQAKPAYPVEGKSRMAGSKDLQAHTRHRDYEEEQKLSGAPLVLWALSGVPRVCKPIFSSKLLQCIRLFLFLHSFRNWESTPLWGHISQCRGHKKSGITNDRKLIKNKRMWWIQGTSGCDLAGALALNTQHTHFGWCHTMQYQQILTDYHVMNYGAPTTYTKLSALTETMV